MARVRIDIPVFYSPTEAFGYATGELDISAVPAEGTPFPWSEDLVKERPAYFSEDQSLICGVSQQFLDDGSYVSSAFADKIPGTVYSIAMYGIVCNSLTEARECAAFLEQALGLIFNEH